MHPTKTIIIIEALTFLIPTFLAIWLQHLYSFFALKRCKSLSCRSFAKNVYTQNVYRAREFSAYRTECGKIVVVSHE